MKKHIPNFVTSLNLFTGAIGCIVILNEQVDWAIFFIGICGIFDFLDGLMARLLQVRSAIGKELDSLADVVSFGLLPGFIMYRLLEQSNPPSEFLPLAGLSIVVFSALRLAKFNIDDSQTDKFIGLPTPANAIMIATLPYLPTELNPGVWALLIITGLSCFLLVAPLTMIALKFKGLSWRQNALKYILIIAIALTLFVFQQDGLPFIIPIYLMISLVGNFARTEGV